MKVMKKFGAVFLALAMCLSLACVAFAADGDTYSITIENSIGGTSYTVYKVFDAKYSADRDEGSGVTYSIKSTDPWYDLVSAEGSPFELTAIVSEEGTDYTEFVVTTTANADEIAAWFNGLTSYPEGSQVGESKEGNGGSLEFDLEEAGYYLIVPASKSYTSVAVTVDTAAPNVTVVDKNQGPGEGPGPGDPEDPTWPGGLTKDDNGESVSIGDEITYSIRSFVPTYNGETKITSYEVTDTMGAGLTYEKGTIKVEIYGTGLEEYEDITDECVIEYDEDTGTLTIKWNIEQIEADELIYPSDAMVRITYKDIVNEAADDTDLTNDVDLVWYKANPDYDPEDPDSPPEIPDSPEDPDDRPNTSDTVYTYGFDLKKTDADGNVLTGAQFTLQKQGSEDVIEFLYDETSNTYEEWDKFTEGTTTTTITVSDGEVNIWGLGAGTYILTETVAPDGYNLLTEAVTIEIAATSSGWTVTVNGISVTGTFDFDADENVTEVHMPSAITVVNNAGTELPGTGGIGTTIFYIIGGVLVAGAVVVLITRRRMSSES